MSRKIACQDLHVEKTPVVWSSAHNYSRHMDESTGIARWLTARDVSVYRISADTGISRKTLMGARDTGLASPQTIEALAQYFELEPWELLRGPVENLVPADDSEDFHEIGNTAPADQLPRVGGRAFILDEESEYIARLEDPVAAGSPTIQRDMISSLLPFKRSFMSRVIPGDRSGDRAVCIPVARGFVGESMASTILPGAVLTVEMAPNRIFKAVEIVRNQVYLVRDEDHGVAVKRVIVDHDRRCVVCMSDNRVFADYEIYPDRGLGIGVIGKVHRWEQGEEGGVEE